MPAGRICQPDPGHVSPEVARDVIRVLDVRSSTVAGAFISYLVWAIKLADDRDREALSAAFPEHVRAVRLHERASGPRRLRELAGWDEREPRMMELFRG
jgi:hypothetical protein